MSDDLTDKQRAAVYREVAEQFDTIDMPSTADYWRAKADELDTFARDTIDKVDGWEVVWCSHGAIAVAPDGYYLARQWWDPRGVDLADACHPWPERPEPLIPDGWTVMSSHELDATKHEAFDPSMPDEPWFGTVTAGVWLKEGPVLVVARERSDR